MVERVIKEEREQDIEELVNPKLEAGITKRELVTRSEPISRGRTTCWGST